MHKFYSFLEHKIPSREFMNYSTFKAINLIVYGFI